MMRNMVLIVIECAMCKSS